MILQELLDELGGTSHKATLNGSWTQ